MDDSQIRVVIVDDHAGIRAGIRRLLDSAGNIQVVGEGANGEEAVQLAQRYSPEVLLLDVEMPVLRGEEALDRIHDLRPDIKVLAVSSYHDQYNVQRMLEHGANGYITKDEAFSLLLQAIQKLASGVSPWLSPEVQQSLRFTEAEKITLTEREIAILRGLHDHLSPVQISEVLEIENALLARYLSLLKAKYQVDTLKALVRSTRSLFPS